MKEGEPIGLLLLLTATAIAPGERTAREFDTRKIHEVEERPIHEVKDD